MNSAVDPFRARPNRDEWLCWLGVQDADGRQWWIRSDDYDALFAEERAWRKLLERPGTKIGVEVLNRPEGKGRKK